MPGTSSAGVFKTTNGGGNLGSSKCRDYRNSKCNPGIERQPTDPNDVLVAVWDGATANATTGMFRTTNGGTLWEPAITGMAACKNILTIARNPLNHNTVYCGTSFLLPNPRGNRPVLCI